MIFSIIPFPCYYLTWSFRRTQVGPETELVLFLIPYPILFMFFLAGP